MSGTLQTTTAGMRVSTGRGFVAVASLTAASAAVRAVTNEVGSTEWYGLARDAGEVYGAGRPLHVSYNGRIWEGHAHEYPTPEVLPEALP